MKIVPEWNYLLRDVGVGVVGWYVLCGRCIVHPASRGINTEVISYSGFPCERCGVAHKAPPGTRPPFKMRTVTYQIVASYPEYDLTA